MVPSDHDLFCLSITETMGWEPFFEHKPTTAELSLHSSSFYIDVDWGLSVRDTWSIVEEKPSGTAALGGRQVGSITAAAGNQTFKRIHARNPGDLTGRVSVSHEFLIAPDNSNIRPGDIKNSVIEPFSLDPDDRGRFLIIGSVNYENSISAHTNSLKTRREYSMSGRHLLAIHRSKEILAYPVIQLFLPEEEWAKGSLRNTMHARIPLKVLSNMLGLETIAFAGVISQPDRDSGGKERHFAQAVGRFHGELFAWFGRYFEGQWCVELKYGREAYVMGTFHLFTGFNPVGVPAADMSIYTRLVSGLGSFKTIDTLAVAHSILDY